MTHVIIAASDAPEDTGSRTTVSVSGSAVLGEIVPFKRRRRRPEAPRHRIRPLLRALPWPHIALLVGAAGLGALLFWPQSMAIPGAGHFQFCGRGFAGDCVFDGDTIRYGGTRIRLLDIDAPEIFSPKCASELALGQKAAVRLLELMNEGPFEVVYFGARDLDRYGRQLREIRRNGRSLGETLIEEGLARRWHGRRRSWCR